MMGKYIERDNYLKAFVVPGKNFCFRLFTNLITHKQQNFKLIILVAAESVKRFGPDCIIGSLVHCTRLFNFKASSGLDYSTSPHMT